MLRKCKGKYSIWENNRWSYKDFELGYFHTWGYDYEEFETGVGNYSIAIVELPDGQIVKVDPKNLQFLDTKLYNEILKIELTEKEIENFKNFLIKNKGKITLC